LEAKFAEVNLIKQFKSFKEIYSGDSSEDSSEAKSGVS